MSKVKGRYWLVDDTTDNLQIKTNQQQEELEEALPGWNCVSYGYIPKTMEDIYVFQRKFKTELDWTKFLNSGTIKNSIEMKEVSND